jgi:ATP-dependent RNA helicase RhlE
MECKNFSDFKLIEPLYKALRDVKYVTPTPVQVQSIPSLLEGRDLLGCAQTGTGKTAAFALPILQRLANNKRRKERWSVRALIVTPTRELAAQIDASMRSYAKYLDITGAVVYGGVGQGAQVKAMDRGVDVLVATPGRLLDLINQGYVHLEAVEIFVLDEADRMLDMGFLPRNPSEEEADDVLLRHASTRHSQAGEHDGRRSGDGQRHAGRARRGAH